MVQFQKISNFLDHGPDTFTFPSIQSTDFGQKLKNSNLKTKNKICFFEYQIQPSIQMQYIYF